MIEDKKKLGHKVDSDLVKEYFKNVEVATGVMRPRSAVPSALQSSMSWFNGTIVITLLTRAAFNAFGEPLNVGIVTGNAMDGIKAGMGTMKALANRGDTEQWASLFESLGIVASGFDEITFTNTYNDTFDSPLLQRLVQRAFRMSGMAALDRASRISAGRTGHAFILASARAHLKAKKAGKSGTIAENNLSRFGIKDADMDAFAEWMTDPKTMLHEKSPIDFKSDGNKGFEQMYAETVGSFIDMAIQNPKAVNKPFLASNPVGKIIFGLMSFSFEYQKNILGLLKTRVIAGLRGEIDGNTLDAKERMQMAVMTIFPMISLYMGVAIISAAREGLTDDDRLEELLKSDDLVNNFWVLAASRAGFFGPSDALLQAYAGLKYRRDLSNSIIGASTGYTLQSMGDILRGVQALQRDESTTRSNEKIVEGLYKLIVAPGVVAGSALLPQQKLLTPAFGAFNGLFATKPETRRAVASGVVDLFD
jgi:hypothetical protein